MLITEPDDISAEDVAALKARGVRPYCYVSVGTWEPWRDDATQFPKEVVGPPVPGWEDEKFLDVRRIDVLVPLMMARFIRCRDKGFLGVEPDNMDAFEYEESGFPLSREDELRYILALRDVADVLGLELGQKNAPELVPDLVGKLDFLLVEQCFEFNFCQELTPYVLAGKDVLAVEYESSLQDWTKVCARARQLGIRLLIKDDNVGVGGQSCVY